MTDSTPERTLPRDAFSTALRTLTANPGAVRTSSKVDLVDLYGNSETWIVDTFRVEGGETVLLQRIDGNGGLRLVLPPAVTEALTRQRDRATTVNRKRGARRAMETRIARGDTIGNPEALLKARRARRKAVR
ncbi:MAG TPA: hypothetical protein VN755_14410 [Steroidobacteraceae bacterium]|nr:hypothetical protein [Steroidobacteraceae bacterium]